MHKRPTPPGMKEALGPNMVYGVWTSRMHQAIIDLVVQITDMHEAVAYSF